MSSTPAPNFTGTPIVTERSTMARPTFKGAMRTILVASSSFALGVACCLVMTEAILRLLPVTSGRAVVVNDDVGGLRRWAPNTPYVYSEGWRLDHPVKGRTNNAGFVSLTDFTGEGRPLVFIGDSFIESEMISHGRAYPDLACARLEQVPCYRVGMARSGLAEYVAMAEYAARTYRPRGIIVNVVEGDIADSLPGSKVPGMHYFDPSSNMELVQAPRTGANGSQYLKMSSFLRYVAMNLRIDPSPRALFQRMFGTAVASGRHADPGQAAVVIPAFLRELKDRTGLAPEKIAIVVDAERSFAHGQEPNAVERQIRSMLIEKATAAGYIVIDLQAPLEQDWSENQMALDSFPADRHWNERAHAVIADYVATRLASSGIAQ